MTRQELVRNIQTRLNEEKGIKLKQEEIKAVLEFEEDEMYVCMASNDSLKYVWGTIGGKIKPPKKAGAWVADTQTVRKNAGWTRAKSGYPYIEWSNAAKICDCISPQEYFEMIENRYGCEAREFRHMAGLPEIPEYQGLSEEKITQLTRKFDKEKLESMYTKRELYNMEGNAKENCREKVGRRLYYKEFNCLPWNLQYYEELGEYNWEGDQRNTWTIILDRADKMGTDQQCLDYINNCIIYTIRIEAYEYLDQLFDKMHELMKRADENKNKYDINLFFYKDKAFSKNNKDMRQALYELIEEHGGPVEYNKWFMKTVLDYYEEHGIDTSADNVKFFLSPRPQDTLGTKERAEKLARKEKLREEDYKKQFPYRKRKFYDPNETFELTEEELKIIGYSEEDKRNRELEKQLEKERTQSEKDRDELELSEKELEELDNYKDQLIENNKKENELDSIRKNNIKKDNLKTYKKDIETKNYNIYDWYEVAAQNAY